MVQGLQVPPRTQLFARIHAGHIITKRHPVSILLPTRDPPADIRPAGSRTVHPGGSNNDHDYLPNLFSL